MFTLRNIVFIFLNFLVLFFSNESFCTAYYVNDAIFSEVGSRCTVSGNDANDGKSKNTPALTIQKIVTTYSASLGVGDTIYVDPGNYNLRTLISPSSKVPLNLNNITGLVISGYSPQTTVIEYVCNIGCNGITFFNLLGCNNITIENLTIRGFKGNGSIGDLLNISSSNGIKIKNVAFGKTYQSNDGFSIKINNSSSVKFEGTTFGCFGEGTASDDIPTVYTHSRSGAMYIGTDNVNVEINGCAFSDNSSTATMYGAGIVVDGNNLVKVNIFNSQFSGNEGQDGSSLIVKSSLATYPEVKIENSCFTNNSSLGDGTFGGYGGAIYVSAGTLSIKNSNFSGNKGISGGAIGIDGQNGIVNISSCTFSGNTATNGADIAVKRGKFTATNCSFGIGNPSSTNLIFLSTSSPIGTITITKSGSPNTTTGATVSKDGLPRDVGDITSANCPTLTGSCPVKYIQSCTTTFSYAKPSFCKTEINPSPTVSDPTLTGIYTCTSSNANDLVFVGTTPNSSTSGQIDLTNSKQGTYIIQFAVDGKPTCKPTVQIIIKPKPATPTLGTPVDPTCTSDGSVLISVLPSPLSGSTTWILKSTAKYNFTTTGNTATYNYTALKANTKIKFIVELDGCLSDSTAELTVANAPGKPYLEGPSSVCVNSEITLKAWTDNTKGTKSTPKVGSAWTLKETSDNDTVSLTIGTDPAITSNKIKGLKVVSSTKAGEATIVYEDNNSCKSEQTIKVNPLPVTPVLSYVTSNTGEIIDTVCIRKDVNFNLSGNVGDSVFFKGKNAPFRYKIISPIPNVFTINNILRDTIIILDSISNGTCVSKFSGSTEIKLKITVADTAFSLKAFPTTNCGQATGKIEVTTYSKGRIVWVNNSDNSLIGKEDVAANTTTMTPILSLKAGTYTVKFLNGGCELSKTVTVSDPNAPYLEADITSSPLSICAGDSIVLKAWTDNTKATKSTPKSNQAWLPDNLNVTLKDTVNLTSTPPTTLQRVVANTGGTSVITYTDINGCKADITVTIKTAGIPTTLNNATDLIQSFCAADINRVSNLKPVGLIWFDEKGTVELAPTTDLKAQFYYAAIKDVSTGCFTKKSDRIKVEVKINANPNDPAANPVQTSFCKVDDPEVADLIPAPSIDIKWFLKSGSTLTAQVPTDKLIKEKYVVKKLKDGCLSVNGVEVEVDVISVPKPKAPNQKLCANNEKPLTLGGLYTSDITNYYFYDVSNASLFPSKIVLDGEQYKVKQSLNGCLSEDTTITIKILNGTSLATSKYILTPAFCKVDGPTLAAIEAKYSALPTSGSIFWYDAQNSSLTNDLPKTADLGGTAYSLWIAVKDADGCFSKKQQVDFTIDPGKKPDLKPIELCKTTDYPLTNLDVANISNPKGTLTWYLSQTGVGLAPPTVPKNSSQKYWASYKETATSCEGERKELTIDWIDLSQPISIDFKDQKFCKTANKTVDDLNPYPFTDANIAWFENTSTNIPYPAIDLLADKIYYASQYQITSAGDYCVNPNRIPVNVALYSNKIYPIVKESVCSKQNGSIEFINPPAGLTFEWYEQSNPTTLDFTGAKYTKPLENQSFKIKIKDNFGCEEEVSVSLPECSDSPIPQILSPNNDAYNNKWVINYSGKYKNVQVRIFNRWGNEVFTSAIPYKDDWDGKRNNDYLPSGTYYYVIDKGNGDPIESGYIELIK